MNPGNTTQTDAPVQTDDESTPPPATGIEPDQPDAATAFDPTQTDAPAAVEGFLEWEAPEFVAHEKNIGWYGMLALGTAVFIGIMYLLTKDEISAGTLLIMAVLFGIFAARKPRTLPFRLDQTGLSVGSRHYPYQSFRSFSVIREGEHDTISFMPMKRLMPLVTIYCPPSVKQDLVLALNYHLPFETRELALVDRLMNKIRF